MSKGPEWFQELSKSRRDAIEQVGHSVWGWVYGLLCLDLLTWRREFVTQWPPGKPYTHKGRKVTQLSRVADTKRDLFWFGVGSTSAHVQRTAALIAWALL